MTLPALVAATGFETICATGADDTHVNAAYTSDLLSDVVAHCPEDSILITVQNHKNTVAVATLVGAVAILVCHGRDIPPDMHEAAANEHVALLRTPLSQFAASCAVNQSLRP